MRTLYFAKKIYGMMIGIAKKIMCLPNIHWRNNIKPSTEIEKKGIFI
jgi:hypothetical protein